MKISILERFTGLEKRTKQRILFSLLFLVATTYFLGLNSLPLFDWDELNFAEIAREMRVTGNYLQPSINYTAFHEKPPLFAWFQLGSYELWGVNSLGARFPNVLCGLFTLLYLWWQGRRFYDGHFGFWWAFFLGGSILPALYFRSGIIDPWFNLFILAALLPTLTGRKYGWVAVLLSGGWLGLAVLTKGPAAGLIAGLCWACLLIWRPEERGKRLLQYTITGLLALVPISVWMALLWRVDDGFFAREFLDYQWRLFFKEDAGHGGFPGYHLVVLLLGCFPASVFALPKLWALRRAQQGPRTQVQTKVEKQRKELDFGLKVLFWVVLILFSIVNTKIVHYSSLCYFSLAYFAARWVTETRTDSRSTRRVYRGVAVIWGVYALVALAVPLLAWQLPGLLDLLRNEELVSRLSLAVSWPWYTCLPAGLALLGVLMSLRFKKHPLHLRAVAQLLLTWLFLTVALPVFAPRIQQYSQGAAVEFYRNLAGQDIYFGTAYYKSYAHWFYGELPPEVYENTCRERQCRFHELITKPLYFSSPLRKRDQVLREVPDAELLYEKGGFAFYRRLGIR